MWPPTPKAGHWDQIGALDRYASQPVRPKSPLKQRAKGERRVYAKLGAEVDDEAPGTVGGHPRGRAVRLKGYASLQGCAHTPRGIRGV